jgi:shikimate kinase
MSDPARSIFLTGFMGCGKSTLGPIAANVLGLPFVDLDDAIVEEAGQTISAIFASEGEAGFRRREAEALRRAGLGRPAIIALGGGAFVQPTNARWLMGNGTVVYLRMPTAALAERLLRSPTPRPLLFGPDGQRLSAPELRARVAALVAERAPHYARAHLTVDVGDCPVGQAVDRLVGAVRRHARSKGAAV